MHSKKKSDTILNKNETISNRNKETKTRKNTKKAETNKNNNANKKDGCNRNKETKAEKRTEETETCNTNNNSKNSDGRARKSTQNTSINYMKVMYINVDSLTNKKSELQDRIHSYKPHIIALTEVNPKNHRFAVTKKWNGCPWLCPVHKCWSTRNTRNCRIHNKSPESHWKQLYWEIQLARNYHSRNKTQRKW